MEYLLKLVVDRCNIQNMHSSNKRRALQVPHTWMHQQTAQKQAEEGDDHDLPSQ